jgi:hypothetical protein
VDHLARSGRGVLAVVGAALAGGLLPGAAGCHRYEGPPVGYSDPRGFGAEGAKVAEAGAVADGSPVPADFKQKMVRVAERAPSQGHAGRFDGVVWANDVGRAVWDAAGDFADGTMLVEEAVERTSKGDRAAGLLVMQKRAGTWAFAVVGADGVVAKDPQEAACVACHRDAPRDFVFRLP